MGRESAKVFVGWMELVWGSGLNYGNDRWNGSTREISSCFMESEMQIISFSV